MYPEKYATVCLLAAAVIAGLGSSLAAQDAAHWAIGPDIRCLNYSVGMPLNPNPERRRGWSFDLPCPNPGMGHVHAVTFNPGRLSDESKIVMRCRIDVARGVRYAP